jgi:hypothetical protein
LLLVIVEVALLWPGQLIWATTRNPHVSVCICVQEDIKIHTTHSQLRRRAGACHPHHVFSLSNQSWNFDLIPVAIKSAIDLMAGIPSSSFTHLHLNLPPHLH